MRKNDLSDAARYRGIVAVTVLALLSISGCTQGPTSPPHRLDQLAHKNQEDAKTMNAETDTEIVRVVMEASKDGWAKGLRPTNIPEFDIPKNWLTPYWASQVRDGRLVHDVVDIKVPLEQTKFFKSSPDEIFIHYLALRLRLASEGFAKRSHEAVDDQPDTVYDERLGLYKFTRPQTQNAYVETIHFLPTTDDLEYVEVNCKHQIPPTVYLDACNYYFLPVPNVLVINGSMESGLGHWKERVVEIRDLVKQRHRQ